MISLYLIIFNIMMIHLKFLIIPIDRAKALEEYVMKPNLRSNILDQLLLFLSDFRNVYHTWSFTHASPTVWNSLPLSLRKESSLSSFSSNLKSYLFRLAFSV